MSWRAIRAIGTLQTFDTSGTGPGRLQRRLNLRDEHLHRRRAVRRLALDGEAGLRERPDEAVAQDLARVRGLADREVRIDGPAEARRPVDIGGDQHAARRQDAGHLAEGPLADGGGKLVQPERDGHGVERAACERERAGVGADETGIAGGQAAELLAPHREHLGGQIEPDDEHVGTRRSEASGHEGGPRA